VLDGHRFTENGPDKRQSSRALRISLSVYGDEEDDWRSDTSEETGEKFRKAVAVLCV
jgi:hypothetical protein